jgi:hypothetical protein
MFMPKDMQTGLSGKSFNLDLSLRTEMLSVLHVGFHKM